jgi:hypothetical protein
MPGYTDNYGFPYPLMTDVVDAAAWQNLANAIDAQASVLAASDLQAKQPPVISVIRNTNQALTLNTLADVTWSSAQYQNPAGQWAAGTTINVGGSPGLYYMTGWVTVQATTVTWAEARIVITNALVTTVRSNNHTTTSLTNQWTCNVFALVPGAVGTNPAVKMSVIMNGTGSPNVTSAGLQIAALGFQGP